MAVHYPNKYRDMQLFEIAAYCKHLIGQLSYFSSLAKDL